jgi:hypothetical protein
MPQSPRSRAFIIAGLAVAGLGVSSLPAHAATLAITSLSCETTPSALLCEGWVSGGSPAYTYTWNPTGRQSNYTDHSINTIYCAVGSSYKVTFGVRDRLGATVSKTISVYCSGGHQ